MTAAVKAKNVVTLEVDGVLAPPGVGVEGVSHTNTQDPLYVGGVPGKFTLPSPRLFTHLHDVSQSVSK